MRALLTCKVPQRTHTFFFFVIHLHAGFRDALFVPVKITWAFPESPSWSRVGQDGVMEGPGDEYNSEVFSFFERKTSTRRKAPVSCAGPCEVRIGTLTTTLSREFWGTVFAHPIRYEVSSGTNCACAILPR